MMRKVERNSEFGIRNSECRLFSRQSRGALTIRNPQSAIRNGLTLIELLVVIVILMTLVGGVIPVLSPNNEARKIREASRGLQTYIMQAQARAARTGRPVGIAFRETRSGSGVALEVFQIEVPLPFTGFSSSSTAIFNRVSLPEKVPQVYEIHFGEMSGASFDAKGPDAIPPRMTRPGDWIRVGNGLFQLKASGRAGELVWDQTTGTRYFSDTRFYRHAELISGSAPPTFAVDFVTTKDQAAVDDEKAIGIFSTSSLRVEDFPRQWTHPNSYRIVRQPVTTSASPYTLPAGVAIDMHASGTEGGAEPTLFSVRNGSSTLKQIGIMFSPSGSVDSVHYSNGKIYDSNGIGSAVETPITDASRLFFLLGRVENVLDHNDMLASENKSPAWINESASDEKLAELQERINWLNMDSRWIVFDTRSGRSVVTENTFVDARRLVESQNDQFNTALDQLDAAREFARQMRSGGGR